MGTTIADEVILHAALEVIAEKGYAGATTRAIAERAEINEVTLFRRFGSKKKLLLMAVAHKAEQFEAAGIVYTGDLMADLVRVVAFYRDLLGEHDRFIFMLVSELPRQPDLMEVVQIPLQMLHRMTLLLGRYQQEGKLVEEPPLQAFLALLGPLMLGGMVSQMGEMGGSELSPAEVVQRYLQGHGREPVY
ncbi:MAG: helix-turn-helix domain containing protein [Chloroflexi bacterium]|nr:helix-turn-helix domain containing protein [Chloroflexota bacterium]